MGPPTRTAFYTQYAVFKEHYAQRGPSLLEQETRRFLQENPNVVFYLQAALGVTAAVICVATVLEDIATLGAGLADDPASFALAYELVRIAQNLPKVASPVGATGTRLILVTN